MKLIEVIGAEIIRGEPRLHARMRRVERNFEGTITRVLDEWGPEFLWYPSWAIYDRFWVEIERDTALVATLRDPAANLPG